MGEAKSEPKPGLRWYQYTLGTLLGLVTLTCLVLGFIMSALPPALEFEEAAAPLRAYGGRAFGDHKLGAAGVTRVEVDNTRLTNADLKKLKEHLGNLPNLRALCVSSPFVDDAGLRHLRGLTGLEYLNLERTHVSDEGVEHLECLTKLKTLWLTRTGVTDEGVKKLQQALPNCDIDY